MVLPLWSETVLHTAALIASGVLLVWVRAHIMRLLVSKQIYMDGAPVSFSFFEFFHLDMCSAVDTQASPVIRYHQEVFVHSLAKTSSVELRGNHSGHPP